MSVLINATLSNGLSTSADNSGEIELQSNGTTALKVNTNEGIQILNCLGVGNATPSTSGAGITFPSTQSASTDANTLDDYEEGTWTPVVTAATGSITSYTVGSATYTKIGRSVTVNVEFTITNNGTGGFRININNSLPFATISGQSFHGAGRENATTGFMVMVQCGGTTMQLWKTDNSYPGGTGNVLMATCTYFV